MKIPIPPDTREEGRYKPDLRKQVRRFLGATGFYRKFVRDFATLTAPLTELTKTTERIKWMPEHTRSWKALQQAMATYPILRQPDSGREYFLDTDASNVGLGAALMQRGDDGILHPVAYASRKLTPVEQTYSTREQEALAIVFAIEKFDCYLAGRRFTVVTDHRSLSWLMTQPMVKGRLANWAYKLRNYDFTIVYRKGSENHLADFLSRSVNVVQILPVQITSNEWVSKERHRAAVLRETLGVVDKGKPRPSRPARTITKPTKVPKARNQAVGPALAAYPLSASPDGVGEGFAGALPCSLADTKAGAGRAPEEQKPRSPADAKSEEKPAEAKARDKWLRLSPEEKDRVKGWNIPGLQSWRMRLRSDPGLSPLLQYLTDDAALSPKADLAELERQATKITVEDGLLVKRTKGKDGESVLELVVPNISRMNLLAEAHDRSHRGIDHTYSTLKEAGYWWPKMRVDVNEYCRKCIICRAAKAGTTGKGLLVGWGIEPRRFEAVHIDFAGPLTKSTKGNSYVLSLVDRATGWIEMVPTPDRTTASAVKALLSVWIPRYGVPKAVVSDNGSHFTSAEFAEACAEYQIRLKTVVPYHPQGNGMVERRFRDMNRAVRIFATVREDWEEILPQFIFGSRNITNSVTGFSPAELVFGEKVRHPLVLDGNFNQYYDQATELTRTLYRLNLAEQVLADKKLSLHQHSSEKASERFEVRDYEVGQRVFIYVDEPPKGAIRREFVPWEGPFKVTEVRPWNLVIERFGHPTTVNKTKCIRVMPLALPDRDLKGGVIASDSPEFKAQQEKVFREKLAYLKQKIASGESAPIGPASPKTPPSRDQSGFAEPQKAPKKPVSVPPARKIMYTADDFKTGDMVVVHLPSKKGRYLGEVRKVWLPTEEAPGDTEKWIRVHLWGRTGPSASTFAPWWIDGRKRCSQRRASHHGELWEDVYASWMRYKLKFPIEEGKPHQEDVARMKALWGHSLELQ